MEDFCDSVVLKPPEMAVHRAHAWIVSPPGKFVSKMRPGRSGSLPPSAHPGWDVMFSYKPIPGGSLLYTLRKAKPPPPMLLVEEPEGWAMVDKSLGATPQSVF